MKETDLPQNKKKTQPTAPTGKPRVGWLQTNNCLSPAQCCISNPLENIRKPKLSLYFHGVKKQIILLKWFRKDESNIKQFIFGPNNL